MAEHFQLVCDPTSNLINLLFFFFTFLFKELYGKILG
jgi:hypothetical protein